MTGVQTCALPICFPVTIRGAYQDAGQFYWENINNNFQDIPFGKDSIPIILPRYLVQDIDTLEDWIRAEFMYEAIVKTIKKD